MAKRAPIHEKPFRPLDASVLHAVLQHRSEACNDAATASESSKVIALVDLAPHSGVRVEPELGLAPVVRRLDCEKRVLFTREETQALDRLVYQLAVRLQTQVKCSHVLRALTSLLLHAEGQVDQRAGESGALTRPANGAFASLQQFERELGLILAHALRDAGLPR